MDATITFTVNGQKRAITADPQRPLLDVLREDLHLTGTKYGCGEARCGACTVLIDGKRAQACVTPIAKAQGKTVLTIEGLAHGDVLHPVQEAFLAEGAFQCGYCSPGMIMGAVALLAETPHPTDEQILAALGPNLCRCNGYPSILKALHRAAAQGGEVKPMTTDPSINLNVTAQDLQLDGSSPDGGPENDSPSDLSRRSFLKVLGSGLLISVASLEALAQPRRGGRGGGGGGGNLPVAARVHIGKDGTVTVLTGKVEAGQGARAELTQAAAEELRLPPDRVHLVMADTGLVPDDGVTAGSRTTPSSVPAVRQGAAAARELLAQLAARRWGVQAAAVEVRDGKAIDAAGKRELTYTDLAAGDDPAKAFQQTVPPGIALTSVKEWKVLGTSLPRPNARDLVTGAHLFPSDISRPGMLYGKVLRPPSYGAKLKTIDPAPAKAMKDVQVVQDGSFVGVTAPTAFAAGEALAALAKTASWEPAPHPSSQEVFAYLRQHARGGTPKNPFTDELAAAAKALHQTYQVPYVQHAPLEPRTAVAEWEGDKLTVWTGSQNPFGCHSEIARALGVGADRVRVIVPDFGGGFGGKHMADPGIEAARLAKAVGKPVQVRWTRAEEFTWAYFRPAAVIDVDATLDAKGMLTSWHFVNINSGGSAMNTPYRAGKVRCLFVSSDSPMRQGSYRALASTANNFARECFMDELAAAAGIDPLAFRLAHLDDPRLRAVLEAAAKKFDWAGRSKKKDPNVALGLACGTEKGSYVAACVEIALDPARKDAPGDLNRMGGPITVRRVCQAFECGAILNPANLLAQVQGCILMGMGPALGEEIRFENGRVLNASFWKYPVPRFADVPELDVVLVNRPDLPSVGAGETPIIAIAPAIANAVFRATGRAVRQMPIRLEDAKQGEPRPGSPPKAAQP